VPQRPNSGACSAQAQHLATGGATTTPPQPTRPTPVTITHLASRRACSQTHHNPPHITITQFRTVALGKSAGYVPKNILDPILIALPQVTHAPHTTTPTCKQQPETHMINTNHRQRMTPRTNQHCQQNLGTTTHHNHARHHS
jgi:hypothetical protein